MTQREDGETQRKGSRSKSKIETGRAKLAKHPFQRGRCEKIRIPFTIGGGYLEEFKSP